MKMNGVDMEPDIYLLSAIVDRLSILVWRQTQDGMKGVNPPTLILAPEEPEEEEIIGYATPEEFEAARQKILKGA